MNSKNIVKPPKENILLLNQKQPVRGEVEYLIIYIGIFLTRNSDFANSMDRYVVQKYISKPFLIDGLKFDFRIYVLLAGCDPLRIFIYTEGLARFSTEVYEEPN